MTDTLKQIGSTVSKLRALLSVSRADLVHIQSLQDALTASLDVLWDSTTALIQNQHVWKETLSLVATGRVLSVSAQAEQVLSAGEAEVGRRKVWCSSGKEYAAWLGRGVVKLCKDEASELSAENGAEDMEKAVEAAAQLWGKSLGLGQNDVVVQLVLDELVIAGKAPPERFQRLLKLMSSFQRRQVMLATVRIITNKHLSAVIPSAEATTARTDIGASAALLRCVLADEMTMTDLTNFLCSTPCDISLTRVAIAALPLAHVDKLLQRIWEQFGDKLHIQHDPILLQESNARLLLLSAGYIHRAEPMSVFMHARSSMHSNAITNRLGSSSPRVRMLGMFVGTAISQLVDKDKSARMDFELEGADAEEVEEWKKLVYVEDKPSSVSELRRSRSEKQENIITVKLRKALPIKSLPTQAKKPMIVEVLDDEDDDDDDLVPYAKPDSDQEDEDEDATLVQRNKPKAPVYIRDLITSLQSDDADTLSLALRTAPSLIRRKASFGAELRDQLPTLASTFTNLQDQFEMGDEFNDLRQAAMIATIVAEPRIMAPWYARQAFSGDYSLSQRAGMLVSIGLAARELGGFALPQNSAQVAQQQAQFPSRMLPPHLHHIYSAADSRQKMALKALEARDTAMLPAQTASIDALTRAMEATMLTPVSTRKSAGLEKRTRIIKNDLAAVVAESFFFPLTGYYAASARNGTHFPPTLLPLLLKTLTLLLTSSGPSVLTLPQLTTELWALLLSPHIRSQALADASTLEAVLFAFLGILSVNESQGDRRRLASECGRMLLETREWVAGVWEGLEGRDVVGVGGGGGGSGWGGGGMQGLGKGQGKGIGEANETERCKVLAAGVLVGIKEVVEQFQRVMVGDMLMD